MLGQQDAVLLGKPTNYLIVKDDVGKAKPTTRRLPSYDFAFGKPNSQDISASTIVGEWKEHVPTLPNIFKSSQPRDFKTLNKKAAMNGISSSKENTMFQR